MILIRLFLRNEMGQILSVKRLRINIKLKFNILFQYLKDGSNHHNLKLFYYIFIHRILCQLWYGGCISPESKSDLYSIEGQINSVTYLVFRE